MYSIAQYKIKDYLRVYYNNKSIVVDNIDVKLSPLNQQIDSKIILKSILGSLSTKDSDLLRLKKIEGYTIVELATFLKKSESAIKVEIHRVMKRLTLQFRSEK